jgi:hypothetical protein
MSSMHVSRPLVGLLVGTVLFFALWLVALKPSSSTSPSSSKGLGQYQSAVDKAHAAVALAHATSAAHGGTIATTPPAPAGATVVKPGPALKPATHPSVRPAVKTATGASSASRSGIVTHALRARKVLALLFYNAAAADDRAVKRELDAVPGSARRVVKLAIPVSELARYTVVTNQVQVSIAPTLVIIDPHHRAVTMTGFADRFEIAQRVADALAVS